jgi:hypothetical protein
MEKVNKQKRNRRKKPEGERRVQLAARVRPDTRKFLEESKRKNGDKNIGRTVDRVIGELNKDGDQVLP